ncbi:MAG: hypothetical protein LUQ47_03190, partial [Methanotrichaceae archaeon]|nr:hypothetical protein [Methanotrichaceae archaeon]
IIEEELASEGLDEYDYDTKFPEMYEQYGEDVWKDIEEYMEILRASKIAESKFSIEEIEKEISNLDRFISAFKHAIMLHEEQKSKLIKQLEIAREKLARNKTKI